MFAGVGLQVLIAVAIFLAGSGAGWGVKGWKDGAEIALVKSEKKDLKSRNDILVAANGQCATDIDGVRKGVEAISVAVGEREKAASAAMRDAQSLAAKHIQAAKAIKDAPIKPDETQCQAIEREQIGYVAARHVGE